MIIAILDRVIITEEMIVMKKKQKQLISNKENKQNRRRTERNEAEGEEKEKKGKNDRKRERRKRKKIDQEGIERKWVKEGKIRISVIAPYCNPDNRTAYPNHIWLNPGRRGGAVVEGGE